MPSFTGPVKFSVKCEGRDHTGKKVLKVPVDVEVVVAGTKDNIITIHAKCPYSKRTHGNCEALHKEPWDDGKFARCIYLRVLPNSLAVNY